MNFTIAKFMEAEPGKPVTLRETHGPDYVHGLSMPFTMKVPPEFIARQAIMPTTADEKELTKKLTELFFDSKKQVVPLGWEMVKAERVYKDDFRYKIGISFASIDTDKQAQYFTADKISIESIKPLQGACFEIKLKVVIHPHSQKDAGWLYISAVESKACYLTFEALQMDIDNESRESSVVPIGSKKKDSKKTESA